jgi:hypothetical protein
MSTELTDFHYLGEGATNILWIEARDAAKYPARHRAVPLSRIIQLKMSLALLFKNSDLSCPVLSLALHEADQ